MDSKFYGSKIIVFVNLKNSKKNPLICTTDIELAISILVKKTEIHNHIHSRTGKIIRCIKTKWHYGKYIRY